MGSEVSRLALAAVAVALTLAGCSREAAPATGAKPATVTAPVKEAQLTTVTLTEEAEKRLGIATAPVEHKPVVRTRTLGGEIVPVSGTAIAITAPVAGTLQPASTAPAPGSLVTKGQTLFRLVPIGPSERDAGVDARQAAETAAARREAAARRAQRAEQLVKDGAGSRRALEDAQADLAVADAELKAARERVGLAGRSGADEGGVSIEAPDTALVQALHVREGQSVAAGAPIVDLVRLVTVWVRVPIYAGESSRIDTRAPADVLPLGSPADADGVTAEPVPAPPSANAGTAGIDLYYAMTNPNQRFRPGERVTVRLPRLESAAGLVVPKSALLHDAYGGTWVYVVRAPRTYARQRTTVTDISGMLAVLAQGPPAGARVVTDGAAELFGVEFGAGK